MSKTVVVIGIGEIGSVFARGMLKTGHTVYPVVRGADLSSAANEVNDPEAVIVAVGEKDIQEVLGSMPDAWKDKLVLVQNELLPRDWEQHNLTPTVISVWFEKKKGQDVKVIIPSPVLGSKSDLVKAALESLDIACAIVADEQALLTELILKNLYILTVNIAGLKVGGTVGELWENHNELARAVANDVLDIQFKLAGQELDRETLINGMVNAFNGDLDHKCMGRSAPARLKRALEQAAEFGFEAQSLKDIQQTSEQASV